MKTKIQSIFIVLIILTGLSFTFTTANAQTEEIVIQTTAQCGECKENIEKALMAEKGVKFSELDIETKKVKVVYNSKKTNPDALRLVSSNTGYDADEVAANPEAVKKLSPCCTKDGHKHE